MKLYINSISSIALAALVFHSCGNKDTKSTVNQQERILPVTTATVSEEIVTAIRNFPATVVALNETELRAEVSGYITNIYVEDGATVKKGQKLYEIDRTRYVAAVDEAKANLNIAESNYARVKKDVERYQVLQAQDAIAKQTVDYAATDLNNQQAQVQAARAALSTATTNLNRSVITAPFNGTVGISIVRNGALVTAGTTLLNTISSTNPIAVEFQVNEKDIEKIIELQRNKSTNAIKVRLPDGSSYDEPGYISTLDRAVDRNTSTIRVRATFNNNNQKLRTGMNLLLNIATISDAKQIVIPYKAVVEQLGVYNVFTVSDSSTAVFKKIKLGQKFEDKVVVESGLQAGDEVIVDGANSIGEGGKVSTKKK